MTVTHATVLPVIIAPRAIQVNGSPPNIRQDQTIWLAPTKDHAELAFTH
jgi:hypothetical protein